MTTEQLEEKLRATQLELREAVADKAQADLRVKHATDLYNAAFNDWCAARKPVEQPK